MKKKQILVAITVLLALGGFWFARTGGHPDETAEPSSGSQVGAETEGDQVTFDEAIPAATGPAAPDPTRRFLEFTPEQRVEFARRGHGPGG